VDEHDGQQYFSMRLIEGGNLAGQAPLFRADPRRAAGLVATVARAIHYAHQRGLLHRDLKPANILLDRDGQPHVTDFGLAKRVAASGRESGPGGLTQSGAIVGTPGYMAPEQAAACKGLTVAADVYALGAILFDLLTGRPPFQAETPVEVVLQVLEKEPPRPRALNPAVERDLETICLKCLRKEPAKRYASAEDLAEDLERWLRGEPIVARPVRLPERAVKWARRRPVVAALVGLVIAGTGAGLGLAAWQWRDAVYQRGQALQSAARAEEEARQKEAALTLANEARRDAVNRAAAEKDAKEQALAAKASADRNLYFQGIASARQAWLTGNAAAARADLDACPAGLRHWEWGFLRRLYDADLRTFSCRHRIEQVTYSPDGTRLASDGSGSDVQLWDAATGKAVQALSGHKGSVKCVAFSPDGRWLASGSEVSPGVDSPKSLGNMVDAFRAGDQDQLMKRFRGSFRGEVKLWDLATGKEARALEGQGPPVKAVCFTQTAGCWQPPAAAPSRCGRRRRARRSPRLPATRMSSRPWRSAREGGSWPPWAEI
jgi:hypothetical protein